MSVPGTQDEMPPTGTLLHHDFIPSANWMTSN